MTDPGESASHGRPYTPLKSLEAIHLEYVLSRARLAGLTLDCTEPDGCVVCRLVGLLEDPHRIEAVTR